MVEVAQGDVRWCGGPNCRSGRIRPQRNTCTTTSSKTRVSPTRKTPRGSSLRGTVTGSIVVMSERGGRAHGGTGISIRALTAIACSGRAESGLHMPRMKMSWNVVRWHSRKTSMPSNTSKLVGTNFNNATSKGLLLRPNTLTSGDPSGVTPCSATGMWSPTA